MTVDEVREAFKAVVGEVYLKISALRPVFGGTQNATVVLPVKEAKKLKDTARIQVGWVSCRLQRREEDVWCYLCWGLGYTARQCTGEDRTQLCFKCRREGHFKANCKREARCMDSGAEGHRRTIDRTIKAGSISCLKKKDE